MIKKTKVITILLSVVWWILLLSLVVGIINILSAKAKGKVPKMFGYSVMHILSGSMEGEIPTGSYILVKQIDPKDIKDNQIICFYSDDPQIYGMPNTHRVVGREQTDEGLVFITKGDANAVADSVPARAERVIGVFVKTLPALTAFDGWLQGNGIMAIFILLQAAVCGMAIYSFVKKKTEGQTEAEGAKADEGQAEDNQKE